MPDLVCVSVCLCVCLSSVKMYSYLGYPLPLLSSLVIARTAEDLEMSHESASSSFGGSRGFDSPRLTHMVCIQVPTVNTIRCMTAMLRCMKTGPRHCQLWTFSTPLSLPVVLGSCMNWRTTRATFGGETCGTKLSFVLLTCPTLTTFMQLHLHKADFVFLIQLVIKLKSFIQP